MHELRLWIDEKGLNALVGAHPSCTEYDVDARILFYSGFNDSEGADIYDGDLLACTFLTDEGEQTSFNQVFWNEQAGCWAIDSTWSQTKADYSLLSDALKNDKYRIVGSIYTHELINCMELITKP